MWRSWHASTVNCAVSDAPAPPLSDDEEGLAQRLAALLVAAWRRHALDEAARADEAATEDQRQGDERACVTIATL